MVKGSVSILLCMRRPATVFWGIIPIVVDAVERVFLSRGIAHIFIKSLKGLPPITNFNAAASVMLVRSLARQRAAFVHTTPSIKDWRISHAVDCYKASARMTAAVAEILSDNRSPIPTIAEAFPPRSSIFALGSFQYQQPTVPIPNLINNLRHNTPLKQMPWQSIPLFAKTLGLPRHELQFYRTSSILARTVYHKYMNLSSGVDNAGFMVYHVTKSHGGA